MCGGKYVIEQEIGQGGFGITYRAVQTGLNRTVCVKEFFPAGKCVRDTHSRTVCIQGIAEPVFEKYRNAFVTEAKMLATLHHPNIVEVIDVFDENDTSYMIMDFIAGQSLQNIVTSRGRLPYPEAVNYMAQIANAVDYIHDRHILHRDIKPDNIMITADYKAILIDFGSARMFEQDKTQVHTSMLTHGYAPTEQYTANSRKGSYTDIYAIGATLYFILTGQVPLEAAARLTEHMAAPKELVPDLPEEANRTILKAMQLKSGNRHQTVKEFMDDLRNIKPSVLIDETIGGKAPLQRRLALIASAAGIALVLAVVIMLRPKPQIPDGFSEPEYPTIDFTGMDLYPMIKVEGGTFIMGNDSIDEYDCQSHRVTLDDFYIGQYEVSQRLWRAIMGDNPSAYKPEEGNDSFPVENVSFDDIQVFIERLNAKTGRRFALPTEAQWEYAARGGSQSTGTPYAGTGNPDDIWFNRENPYRIDFPPSVNELGIYQMSGNVAEWCEDYYDAGFYEVSCDSRNPRNGQQSKYRVIRGGSYNDREPKCVTVFYREADNEARPYVGFRLTTN